MRSRWRLSSRKMKSLVRRLLRRRERTAFPRSDDTFFPVAANPKVFRQLPHDLLVDEHCLYTDHVVSRPNKQSVSLETPADGVHNRIERKKTKTYA